MTSAASRSGDEPATPLVLVGALLGLAWACGLRGFMAQVAGADHEVSWSGTFVWILLPGMLTGALLGWAEHLRRAGGSRRWRWLALAPLTFASVLVFGIFDPENFLRGGVGGGAIGVPVYAMVGGYALSGRGPAWGRALCGVMFASAVPIWALTAESIGGPSFALDRPQGLWVALYYWSFLLVLAVACSIPHRPVTLDPDGIAPSASRSRSVEQPG